MQETKSYIVCATLSAMFARHDSPKHTGLHLGHTMVPHCLPCQPTDDGRWLGPAAAPLLGSWAGSCLPLPWPSAELGSAPWLLAAPDHTQACRSPAAGLQLAVLPCAVAARRVARLHGDLYAFYCMSWQWHRCCWQVLYTVHLIGQYASAGLVHTALHLS